MAGALKSNAFNTTHYMRLLIDAAPVAMLVVRRNGSISVANRVASETFGFSVDQLVSMNIDQLVPPHYRAGHHKKVEHFFEESVPRVMGSDHEVQAMHSSGRQFPVEIGLSPVHLPDGSMIVFAAILNITERRKRERESTLARLVQESMLPEIPDNLPGIELAARSVPADATGGDFYDFHRLPGQRLEIVAGDASGHGFAAALVTATARSYLRALCGLESDLGMILERANLLLIDDSLDSRFVTLLFAVFDPIHRTLSYSGAGQLGYLLKPDGELQALLNQVGSPLGWFCDARFPVTTLALEPGNLIVFLTDGIEEAMNPKGVLFGRERVLELMRREHARPVREIVEKLHEAVDEFCSPGRKSDDATVIVGRIQ